MQPGLKLAVVLLLLPPAVEIMYKWEPGLKLNLGWMQDSMETDTKSAWMRFSS